MYMLDIIPTLQMRILRLNEVDYFPARKGLGKKSSRDNAILLNDHMTLVVFDSLCECFSHS